MTTIIDLSPTQAGVRITTLLDAPENRTLDFKRIGSKRGRMIETKVRESYLIESQRLEVNEPLSRYQSEMKWLASSI
jgi:hypothetical protein